MKSNQKQNLIYLIVLIIISTAALFMATRGDALHWPSDTKPVVSHTKTGILGVSAHLVQQKVLQGSDGRVGMELVIKADEIPGDVDPRAQHVDMVVVLDRSGSMSGVKIQDARRAIMDLIGRLSGRDRLALISYSTGVRTHFDLLPVNNDNRPLMESAVRQLSTGGSTNLGAGLQAGIRMIERAERSGKLAKLILISDGLANRGVVDPNALGRMAAEAVRNEFAVSTVGVGDEFNEFLMTTIADRGTGNYYYLDNPQAFAEVFQKEFYIARTTVATGVAVNVPLAPGVALVDASGYPLTKTKAGVVFHPGILGNGQNRRFYLTFQVPTKTKGQFEIRTPEVSYRHNGEHYRTAMADSFTIACVADETEVFSSIDRASWQDKVLQEDFNRLRQEVAADIKSGEKEKAIGRIERYYDNQSAINAAVKSEKVKANLDKDVKELRKKVDDTFTGAPAAVEQKQKSNAKSIQYKGYSGRRTK